MTGAVVIARTLLTQDGAATVAIVGPRVYRADGVVANAARPYIQLTLVSETPDVNLDGSIDEYAATVKVDLVVDATAAGSAALPGLLAAVIGDLHNKTGTIAGATVTGTQIEDVGDEPSGPTDSQGQTTFMQSVTVGIAHK